MDDATSSRRILLVLGGLALFAAGLVVGALWSPLGDDDTDDVSVAAVVTTTSTTAPTTTSPRVTRPLPETLPAPTISVVSPETTVAADGTREYIVQRGDTLTKIAERFGTTVAAIVALNGIENPDKVAEGARLKIPPAGATDATTSTTLAPRG